MKNEIMTRREIEARINFLKGLIQTVDDNDRYNEIQHQIEFLEEALKVA